MTQKIIRMDKNVQWNFGPYPQGEITDSRTTAQQADHSYLDDEQSSATFLYAGIWRSEPCTLEHDHQIDEMCMIVAGHATIKDLDSGQEEQVSSGDVFLMRRGFKLQWDIHSDLTKYYMIVKPQ